MKRSIFLTTIVTLVLVVSIFFCGCGGIADGTLSEEPSYDPSSDGIGGGSDFRIPVPQGFDWEVSQSWGEHCEVCDEKYPLDPVSYCDSSHATLPSCRYGWDFNLPGNADLGKSALAVSDGTVKIAEECGSWGNTVVIDHGDGICSRYSHLDSIAVNEDNEVCQGLKLGEIGNTGNSEGSHLHFQFEDCSTGEGMEMWFTDGNGIPKCIKGSDIYDEDGHYIALLLTNEERYSCDDNEDDDNDDEDNELPENGWVEAECGDLNGCPLVHDCDRSGVYEFPDSDEMSSKGKDSVSYLWRECAVDGKEDESFHPSDDISRAEVLKISLTLFGLNDNCDDFEPFEDVDSEDWFYPYIVCAISYEIIDSDEDEFRPNDEVTFVEAAKMAVLPAVEAGVIELKSPDNGHFPDIDQDHWAYTYVETLYAYGALEEDPEDIDPDGDVSREEFAIMVASLSPCFCWNIICEGGCQCSQKEFACVDPDEDNSNTGGGDDDTSDDDNDDVSDDDNDDNDDTSDDDTWDDDNGDDDDNTSDDDTSDDDTSDDDTWDDDNDDIGEDGGVVYIEITAEDFVWLDSYGLFSVGLHNHLLEFRLAFGGELCWGTSTSNKCVVISPAGGSDVPCCNEAFMAWAPSYQLPSSPSECFDTIPESPGTYMPAYDLYSATLPGCYNFQLP